MKKFLTSLGVAVALSAGAFGQQQGATGGQSSSVGLVAKTPVDVYIPINNPDRLTARIVYRWPLTAPVDAGYEAGTLKVFSGTRLVREIPLYTDKAVERGSLGSRAFDALMELTETMLFSWLWNSPTST